MAMDVSCWFFERPSLKMGSDEKIFVGKLPGATSLDGESPPVVGRSSGSFAVFLRLTLHATKAAIG
jgi:hypothetical protein